MRLDQALVQRKLCESRQEAQEAIALGHVFVDGIPTTKQTKQITDEMTLTISQRRKFVSRGGDKLEGALLHVFHTEDEARGILANLEALDVGSSTGGFTDCLLSYGVTRVTAIDVGTSQLHNKLRADERVTVFENTDIRTFVSEKQFDIIVADLSFIPLEKVLDAFFSCTNNNSILFLLIKPQFEVGKGNTKKGIVKDDELVEEVLTKYKHLVEEKGLRAVSVFPCSIAGGDGNQEYFMYGRIRETEENKDTKTSTHEIRTIRL